MMKNAIYSAQQYVFFFKISSSHGGKYKDDNLLRYSAV
jgi:hypothetical protein